MIGFTKQEKRYVIVLIVSFLSGLCFDYYNKKKVIAGNTWKDKQILEINTLADVTSSKPNKETISTEIRHLTDKKTDLTKKSLVEKININKATIEELQLLPQIGPVLAQNIIEYRNRNGSFKTKEEIQKVKKIGQKTYNKIEKSITVK
ncbi:helix-hairpin-helix domain-containing protein [candidate division KSB1 bacterium]|nr:helix-hairpin-helix domain-containing protein [candidate division KSB1 bacterium]